MQGFHFLVRFTKLSRSHFLSHRDLMTIFERAVRGANIPIVMSEGFNPRPRISFPTALGLGIESDDEIVYLRLSEWMSPAEIQQRLSPKLIDGIRITSVEPVRAKSKPSFLCVKYEVTLEPSILLPTPARIQALLDSKEIIVERTRLKGLMASRRDSKKRINIRPYLENIKLESIPTQSVGTGGKSLTAFRRDRLSLSIRITDQGTARPEEVISALGIPGSLSQGSFHIRKTQTCLTDRPACPR